MPPADFVRLPYRDGFLSEAELPERLYALSELQAAAVDAKMDDRLISLKLKDLGGEAS